MAHNRPVHFEIHAEDPERAATFYTSVFGWQITKWDNPAMEYWMVMTGKAESGDTWPGIDGGIVRRIGDAPNEGAAVTGFVCTMTVESLDETERAIIAAGGKLALEKFPVPGMGWMAYYKDTELNIFGVMQEDPAAR